jgi:hypothetical protein
MKLADGDKVQIVKRNSPKIGQHAEVRSWGHRRRSRLIEVRFDDGRCGFFFRCELKRVNQK